MPTLNNKMGEMLHKRTPNSKTWMNFDGSYTTEIHSGVVHFEDQHGNLQNINTDLYDEADFDLIDEPVAAEGVERFKQAKTEAKAAKKQNVLNRSQHNFQALRVPFDAHIPRNFQRGYTIGKGQDKLTFKPVKSSPAMGELSQTDRSIIVYQDVWNDTDVELQVQPNGLKETIHLKTSKAPTSFSFEVKGKDIAEDSTAGVLKLMPAWLVDADGTERDVEQVVIRSNDNKMYVELKADVTDLVYPIAIDPTVVVSSVTKDKYEAGSTNYENTQLSVGKGGAIGSSDIKTYIQFDLSTIPAGSLINSANLNLKMIYATTNTNDFYIDINPLTGNWSETSVSNTPFDSTVRSNFIARSLGDFSPSITPLMKYWIEQGNPNYGMRLIETRLTTSSNSKAFSSSEGTSPPSLSVNYNAAPTSPVVTAPNGGESWNSLHAIAWNPSTDIEKAQSSLQYNIQLSSDNGTTWKEIVALSPAGVTTHDYDFINEAETATAKIRIRAYDGASYGAWDESDGVFTIVHNLAPDTPINLLPSGGQARNRAEPLRLSWTHNDPNAGDPQSKYDLQWRLKGTSVWITDTRATPEQSHDLIGLAYGFYEWQVRTYDQAGLSSPYSDIALFLAADKPAAPIITNYSEGATVAVANPTIQWSSADQAAYKVVVKDAAGAVVWTEEKVSGNKAVTAKANLENQAAYKFELSIRNLDGLWSDITAINVNVSYTPPAVPVVTIAGENQQAAIRLAIANPTPVGTEPVVSQHELFRKASNESDWIRVGHSLPINGSYTDHTPASGKEYAYYARAWGENGTYRDSAIVRQTITLSSIWLMDPQDPDSLHRFHYFEPGRTAERIMQGQLMEFEGRSQPMAEFSSREQRKVNVVLQLKKDSLDLAALEDLIGRRTALLYRDAKGRRIYGTVFALSETETDYGYTVPLEVQQVGYEEEV